MLGIDVSKDQLATALIDPATKRARWQLDVSNDPKGIAQLLQRTPAEVAWVLEPTGRYSLSVAQQARAAGRVVLLAPARKARQFMASIQTRAKTDHLDCVGLGLFGLSRPLALYPINSETVERVQQLLRARRTLSESLAKVQQQLQELPHARAVLTQTATLLREQLKALDKQLASESQHFPAMKQLAQVHGIGLVTSAAVSACLKAKQFSRSSQFVAYIGLDIAIRQSGRRAGERGITREGDAELRRLLYLCAQASLRATGSPFRLQYERELAKGLSRTAALCAVARKMARLCWSMEHHGTTYDPTRVYRQN